MAFKIKNPLHFDGTIDPSKKLTGSQMNKSIHGSKDSWMNDVNNDGNMFTRAISSYKKTQASNKEKLDKWRTGVSPTVNETKNVKTKKLTGGSTKGDVSGGKVKSQVTKDGEAGYEADDKARKNKTGIYAPKKRKKAKTLLEIGKVKLKTRKINIGDQKSIGEKDVLDSTPKISTKKPTIKAAPKDNSRKAIKKRKTADKKAGVSKSQMRANKAKSKSEAALAKAKKSKNPDFRAQLKRKADRLAARAKRKGGSPAKAIGDPKNPKRKYGKVTVKKEKKDGVTTVTATRPYSTSGGKKTYKQFEKEGGDVAAAKKFNKGKETKSITIVDKKPKGIKAIPTKSHKPKIDLKAKPKKGGSGVKTTIVPGKKKKQPKITKAKVRGNRKLSGLGRVKGCK